MPKHHTVIFVRNEGSQLRKWRLTTAQILTGIALLVALGVGSAISLSLFLTARVDQVELAQLQNENDSLRSTNEGFETRLQSLQARLTESEDRTRQLAIVAGLGSTGTGTEGGIGGEVRLPGPPAEVALTDLESRSGSLLQALDGIENRLGENLRLISSTPAIAPVHGLISSPFGYRRDPITGQRAFHSGIDISAPPGRPVKSAAAGIVTRTERSGGLGRAVFVAHGYGIVSVYGHLSRVEVKPGQRLERGQIVGLVGNTGRATGYHLHYEVQVDGKSVNPLAYMLDGAQARR